MTIVNRNYGKSVHRLHLTSKKDMEIRIRGVLNNIDFKWESKRSDKLFFST